MAHPFVGVIVQVDMRDFHVSRRQRVRVHGKTVILRGDFHLFCEQILNWMIRFVMAEFQFEGFAPKRQSAKLMPEANPENGHMPNELANGFNGVADGLGIAGPIREKNPIRLQVENIFRWSPRGRDPHVAIVVHKEPQNVLLDAVVKRQNAMLMTLALRVRLTHLLGPRRNRYFDRALVPSIRLRARHPAGKLEARHLRQLLGLKNQLLRRSPVRRDHSPQSANVPDVAHQRARINVPNNRNFVTVQIKLSAFRRSPVGRDLREFADNQRLNVRPPRLFIFKVRADVADMRIREADNLPRIAWVGENFLITGEAGVENDFAAAARDSARGASVKEAPVFQREGRGSVLDFCQWSLP